MGAGAQAPLWSSTLGDVPPGTLDQWFGGGSSGPAGIVETSITTAGNGTLTAAALVGGQIARTGPTAAYSDATDTAAAIVAALGAEFISGEVFIVRIKNGTTWVQTLTAGAGVTLPLTITNAPLSTAWYYGTVGGTATAPTVTFTHMFNVPLHTATEVANPQTTTINTNGAGTLTAAAINGGVILRTTAAAAFTDTTDSVANLLAGVTALIAPVGASAEFTYVNNTVAPATIAGASSVTVTGQTVVPPNSWAKYLLTVTGATTISMVCVGAGYFPHSGTFTANGASIVTVSDTNVTATSQVNITLKTVGGTVNPNGPHLLTITPGTGFTVNGAASDTSVYSYTILG